MAWRAGNLARLAKQRGWMLIPLLAVVGKRIVPDGTIRDGNGLPEHTGRQRTLRMISMSRSKRKKPKVIRSRTSSLKTPSRLFYIKAGSKLCVSPYVTATSSPSSWSSSSPISSPTSKVSKPPSLNSRTACPIWPRAYSRINVLDPCTGTGNFVVNLLRRVSK